jgi:hypothetical protein
MKYFHINSRGTKQGIAKTFEKCLHNPTLKGAIHFNSSIIKRFVCYDILESKLTLYGLEEDS